MTYRSTKWLILFIPTLTIGLWEYVRHTLLLPYLSMETGNLLAPVIVLAVTVTVVRKLFAVLEDTQLALERERVATASLAEREQVARELHDGISQSLFLLSVKLDRLDRAGLSDEARRTTGQIRSTVKHIYEDVRQLIDNLQAPKTAADVSWLQSIRQLAGELEQGSGMRVELDLRLPDGLLTSREKVELLAILREAMFNAQKHAMAGLLLVACEQGEAGAPVRFRCVVADDGIGVSEERLGAEGHYGIRMMRDRAKAMGWELSIAAGNGQAAGGGKSGTRVEVAAAARRPDR